MITDARQLLKGPYAKAKLGDFKLVNSKVAFIIEKAGRSSLYDLYGGGILDADLTRPDGGGKTAFEELISAFNLNTLEALSVEVLLDGRKGGPAVVRVRGREAPNPFLESVVSIIGTGNMGLEIVRDYILDPDMPYLKIVTTIYNPTEKEADIYLYGKLFFSGDWLAPYFPGRGFNANETAGFFDYFGMIGDGIAYSWFLDVPVQILFQYKRILLGIHELPEPKIAPGNKTVITEYFVVSSGGAADLERIHRSIVKQAPPPAFTGRVLDSAGKAIPGALVHVTDPQRPNEFDQYMSHDFTDQDGKFEIGLARGAYEVLATAEGHLPTQLQPIEVAGNGAVLDITMEKLGKVRFKITDPSHNNLPAKLTYFQTDGTPLRLNARYGQLSWPFGAAKIEMSPSGEGITELAPGKYSVTISRGFEYDIAKRTFEVMSGAVTDISATLTRVVDTTGWMCGDFHIHAQNSVDSQDLNEFKVASFAAEGLEVPISTDHEWVTDYAPVIEAMGLQRFMKSIIGEELTTYTFGHFNPFPMKLDPGLPNNGAVDWYYKSPPEFFAEARRRMVPGGILQINHPRSASIGGYFSAVGFDRETFTWTQPSDWSPDFDAIEVLNGGGIGIAKDETLPDWYVFLNRGYLYTATGNSDSHNSLSSAVGYPRNCVRIMEDDPRQMKEDAFIAAVKAQKVTISGGPFVTFTIEGTEIGGLVAVSGAVKLKIKVQAPEWMAVNSLQVVANGKKIAERVLDQTTRDSTNPVIRFNEQIEHQPDKDTWYVVLVEGDTALRPVASPRAFSFTNPIYVDYNGNGRYDPPL